MAREIGQLDVRSRGKKTTIKVLMTGRMTLERMADLCDEATSNQNVPPEVRDAAAKAAQAAGVLRTALEATDPKPEAAKTPDGGQEAPKTGGTGNQAQQPPQAGQDASKPPQSASGNPKSTGTPVAK